MAMEHGDTTLQQQFLQLQEQQQQKMAKRQQQKKEKKVKIDSAKEEKKATFGVDDDLQLGSPGPTLQTSDYISEELVQHLNDQIRELKDETGRLYKCLSEKDYEIRYMTKKREEDRLTSQCVVTGPTNEVAATKIVELSKKIRELNAEVESERTRTKQYARKCAQLEKELRAQASLSFINGDKSEIHDAPPPGCVTEAEFKAVADKLRGAENKAAEFKMQHQSLKQEIQKLSKALSLEVGDGYNLQSILANNSSWRGRQQQMLLLQKKVNEMRTELNHYKLNSSESNLDDTSSMGSATRRQSEESQTRERIRKIERERKESLERSVAELRALEVDHEDVKKRLEGAKARNKVLSNELKSVKQQVTAMLEKGKNDDDLIKALMQQLETFKKLADDATDLHQKAVQSSERHMRELREKTQQDGNVTDQLKLILAQKDEKLHHFEAEVERLKEENLHLSQTQTMNQLFANRHESGDDDAEFSPDELDDPELEMIGNHDNRRGSRDSDNTRELSTLSITSEKDSKASSPSKKKKKNASSPGSQGSRRGSHGNRTESAKSDKKVHFTPRKDETDLSTNVPAINMDILQVAEGGSGKVPQSPNSRNNSARSIASDVSEKPPRPSSGKRPSTRPPPSPLSRQSSNSYAQKHAQSNSRLHSAAQNNSRPNSALKLDHAESETLQRAAEVERDRLNELVSNLQFRINEMTLQVTDVANELQSQKRLNVALEKQLGKSKMEQTSVRGGKSSKMNRSLANLEADLTDTELMATDANIRDLQLSLALQQDENQALKSALQSTLQAKEEDLRLYQETISETRKIFLHGIRNFKTSS